MSLDDFYLLGSGLMMTQTTNNMFNASLYALLTPNSLLAWQRVRLAHSLARTGQEWADTFAMHNSGQRHPPHPRYTQSRIRLPTIDSPLPAFGRGLGCTLHTLSEQPQR